jgi:23S rRNA (uracil1939-C5)-methyltransferase
MIELLPHDIAHGGEAVARRDGKTYFVAGAMPGERVEADVVQDKGNWARAELDRILVRAPERVDPPCPHFSACGGCR